MSETKPKRRSFLGFTVEDIPFILIALPSMFVGMTPLITLDVVASIYLYVVVATAIKLFFERELSIRNLILWTVFYIVAGFLAGIVWRLFMTWFMSWWN